MQKAPENADEFFPWLKNESESFWAHKELKGHIYGFQIEKGTKWLAGLSTSDIGSYERDLGVIFPDVYKKYLSCMNGTDKQTVNVYGSSGEPYKRSYYDAFYSYPRDIELLRQQINWVYEEFGITEEDVNRRNIPHIIPIVGHRCLVADQFSANPILSMYGRDVILYASNLMTFLYLDIFCDHSMEENLERFGVKLNVPFWLKD
ncbi:MAG TPA: hypothetical protein VMU16_04560 [Candidatus Binataceae bacterium]|nr:hypothetical protein [Candidatus Binataceae bacterium]